MKWVLESAYPQHRSVEEWGELLALYLELHLSVLSSVQMLAQALALVSDTEKERYSDPRMALRRT